MGPYGSFFFPHPLNAAVMTGALAAILDRKVTAEDEGTHSGQWDLETRVWVTRELWTPYLSGILCMKGE